MKSTRLAPGDLIGLGLLGIRTRPARAALSALGIAIGIATLVLVTAIPASSRQALQEQLNALGTDRLQAVPVPDRDPPVVLPKEAAAMVARIAPVTASSAVGDFGLTVARSDRMGKGDYNALAVLAATPDLLKTVDGRVNKGRFLDAVSDRFPTVVLGSVAAERLGLTELDASSRVQVSIGDARFTVVGILARTPLSPEIDRAVLIGWDTAERRLRFDGHPTRVYVQTTDDQVEQVAGVLAATVDPEHPGNVLVNRPSDALIAKRAVQQTFNALFLALAGVALLIGGIGVANTMYISVLERRREIGLRRALGASRGQVRVQFMTESVVLSVLGGLTGTVAGVIVTAVYCVLQHWPVVVPVDSTAGGLGGALVVGVVAGVYPAIRASRLNPTESLSSV
jgi:putative ABC transport system permease protein